MNTIEGNKLKVLHLTLKKKWFDMIASGEKKEEYREKKDYWITRLCEEYTTGIVFKPKHFDVVRFAGGGHFHPAIPTIDVQCLGIDIRQGEEKWGAEPNTYYFVIKLGEIISNTQSK